MVLDKSKTETAQWVAMFLSALGTLGAAASRLESGSFVQKIITTAHRRVSSERVDWLAQGCSQEPLSPILLISEAKQIFLAWLPWFASSPARPGVRKSFRQLLGRCKCLQPTLAEGGSSIDGGSGGKRDGNL